MQQTSQQQPNPQVNATTTDQQGVQGWLKVVIATTFYAGLTVFLLSSIGHVAWFFHLYEPKSASGDWLAMVPSYGKAGALDLAIFFLAYVAATGQAADKVLTWTFTALLTGVSLYANYIYAMFFSPQQQAHIWQIQLLWGVTTTGWLSPIIASSYPLFAMIFMYLIERVISRKAETPQEMRERLHALKEKKAIEQEIKNISSGQVKSAAITAIDSGLDVFNHFKNRVAKRSENTITDHESAPESTITEVEQQSSTEEQTDLQEAISKSEGATEHGHHEGDHRHSKKAEKQGQERDQASPSVTVSGRSLVSVEEAAKLLLIEPKTVETLRNRGVLKVHPGNRDRITMASIRAYDEKRSRKPQKAIKAASPIIVDANPPGLMIVPDDPQETGVDRLDATLSILKELPEITDEELAVKLDLKRPASARFWRLKAEELIKMSSSRNPEPITTVTASS